MAKIRKPAFSLLKNRISSINVAKLILAQSIQKNRPVVHYHIGWALCDDIEKQQAPKGSQA